MKTTALFTTEASLERSQEREAREAALRSAAALQRELEGLLPTQRADLARAILSVQSKIPLWHIVDGVRRINSVEFTSRLMRLQDAIDHAPEAKGFAFEFRPSNKKGWAPSKSPTPGARSGASKNKL